LENLGLYYSCDVPTMASTMDRTTYCGGGGVIIILPLGSVHDGNLAPFYIL